MIVSTDPTRFTLASGGCRFQTSKDHCPQQTKWKRGPARGRCPAQGHPGCHQQSPGSETETSRPLEVTLGQRTLETVGLGGAALGIRPSTPPRLLQPARRLRQPRRGHHRGHSGVRHRGSLTPACGRSPIPRRPQLRVSGEQRRGTQLGPEKHVGHFREGNPASSVIRKKTPTGRRWEGGYHRDGAASGG